MTENRDLVLETQNLPRVLNIKAYRFGLVNPFDHISCLSPLEPLITCIFADSATRSFIMMHSEEKEHRKKHYNAMEQTPVHLDSTGRMWFGRYPRRSFDYVPPFAESPEADPHSVCERG